MIYSCMIFIVIPRIVLSEINLIEETGWQEG